MNKSTMNNPTSNDQDGKKDAIVDQAKQAVSHVASQAKEQVSSQISTQFDGRKDKAVETMGNVADAIRGTSEKLKGVGPLGDVAGRAADGIESVAEFFEGKQIGDIVKDVNRFARREPALFIGAAFAIGLIGGRFLKSSARASGTVSQQGAYAREGGYSYDRYDAQYGGSFGDGGYDDFLSEDDLEDDVASQRSYGSYGSQRTGRTTQQFGSQRTGGASSGGSTSGSSYGSSQGSTGSTGSSYGATQGSGSGSTSSAPNTTTKSASVAPAGTSATSGTSSTTPSTSPSTSATPNGAAKNGIGGGSNSGMGSV